MKNFAVNYTIAIAHALHALDLCMTEIDKNSCLHIAMLSLAPAPAQLKLPLIPFDQPIHPHTHAPTHRISHLNQRKEATKASGNCVSTVEYIVPLSSKPPKFPFYSKKIRPEIAELRPLYTFNQ